MCKLEWGGTALDEAVDNLDKELLEFLPGNGTNFEMVEATDEKIGDFVRNGSFGDIKGLVNVKCEYFFHIFIITCYNGNMKTFIVGNWKLNFTVGEASIYLHKLQKRLPAYRDVEVVIAPAMIALQPLSLQIDRHKMKLAAQNAFYRDYGAYTGETSCFQLRGLVDYVLIGHSERRYVFCEDDKLIAKKVESVIRNKMTPILCVGETENERAFGEMADALRDQVLGGLREVSAEDISKVIIAYEPVWAISTVRGAKCARPEEVAEAVRFIRATIAEMYGEKCASEVAVLFGGSVVPDNAGAYLTVPGVNGLVVGGSSLILDEFVGIIDIAKRVRA